MASYKSVEYETLLNEVKEKRSKKFKDILIHGQQKTLNHYITFFVNITAYAKFFVDFQIHSPDQQPLVIEILLSIADIVTILEFQHNFNLHLAKKTFHGS